MIKIDESELDKLYENNDLKKGWTLEAFWILFNDCQKMWSSMLLKIAFLIQAIEWEWKKTLEEYLETDSTNIPFFNDEKAIYDIWVATFMLQYKNEIAKNKDKEIFDSIEIIPWRWDWLERSKYDWEFEYKWKHYLVISPLYPWSADYDEFLELISTPKQYLQRISVENNFKNIVTEILSSSN